MLKTRDKEKIVLIIDHCKKVKEYVKDLEYDDFLNNTQAQDAISFNILQIGELAKSLSDEFISEYNAVPWKSIKGMRDKICHGYESINKERVFETARKDVKELNDYCKKIVKE